MTTGQLQIVGLDFSKVWFTPWNSETWTLTGRMTHPKGRLTFPAAMRDRANWYQSWNSSKANFMALSKHWSERRTIADIWEPPGAQLDNCEFVSMHIKSYKTPFPWMLKTESSTKPLLRSSYGGLCQKPGPSTADYNTTLDSQVVFHPGQRKRQGHNSNTRPRRTSAPSMGK